MNIRTTCTDCRGRGWTGDDWTMPGARCKACDGIGEVFVTDAPAFGCSMSLADFDPGDRVLLGTGERARVQWHQPRKARKLKPEVTFVTLIDDFDDYESSSPTMYPSTLGVREPLDDVIIGRKLQDEDHAGEKDADELDPMATRTRTLAAGDGDLL